MALETATYIDGLVATNPAASDAINTADDHLRLIKSTIKATFPNITGPVTATQAALNGAAPLASPTFTGTPAAPTAAAGTNTTQLATTAFVTAALQALYPVGSIYTNATNSTNPGTLLGFGTWTAFAAGRVMVGFNASDASFDLAEKTGGSKDAIVVSHTHSFSATTSSNGSHSHTVTVSSNGSDDPAGSLNSPTYHTGAGSGGALGTPTWPTLSTEGEHTHSVSGTTGSTGSSETNANLQPYITVYMWKRTA